MSVSDIPKVIYAPHKAFKEILQNPKYLGAFILLIIFVVVQVGSTYTAGSREFLEITSPAAVQGDYWAQNAGMWQANPGVTIRNNTANYINSTATPFGGPAYFGSNSVEFTVTNVSSVRMELKNLNGSVDCSADGFRNVTLNVKIVNPDIKPGNVSLYLDSLNASSFYHDLTSAFSNSASNVWNNITINLDTAAWSSSSNVASWQNITGIRMEFMWTGISNVDLRVGGLFFGGIYKDYVTLNGGAGPYLAQGALSGIAPFIFEWIILTGLLYIIIKGLRGTVTWKPLMVAVGFALVTLVVQTIIVLVVYSTLPTLYLPVEVLANVSGGLDLMPAATVDAINSAQFITGVVQIAIYIWIVGLGALITRSITTVQTQTPPVIEGPPAAQQFGWLKSILVSAAALLLTILILGFLLG